MGKMRKLGTKKIILLSVVGSIGLFFMVVTIGFWSVKPLLSKRLKAAVLASTDSLYHLDFEDISYEIVTGSATVSGVVWRADANLYGRLKKAQKLPDNIYQGKVDHIKLTGLHPWTIFFSKKLQLNTIFIKDPNVELIHEKQPYNSFKTAKSPYQIISKFVESFSVRKIIFENINFTYSNLGSLHKPHISRVENLDLEVSDLLIDSVSGQDKKRFYYTKECIFSLKKVQIPSQDSLNTLKINELLFSTETRSLSVRHMV